MFSLNTIKEDKAKDFVDRLSDMLESDELTHLTGEYREEYIDFYESMISKAVIYAKIRADWEFYSRDMKIEKDERRTACHDDFIMSLKVLIRYANKLVADVWKDLEEEVENIHRKDLGDIACYITYLIAVSNR